MNHGFIITIIGLGISFILMVIGLVETLKQNKLIYKCVENNKRIIDMNNRVNRTKWY